ncbi:MAG: hypothetical protein H7232_12345, partial [Aeromicrobium sp.]|nr:hypothetical protein [Burkholderiales bacterium]
RQGLARALTEGPIDFLNRIEHDRPQDYVEATKVIAAYVAARYAPTDNLGGAQRRFIQLARRFRAV